MAVDLDQVKISGAGFWVKVATLTYSNFALAALQVTSNSGYKLPAGYSILGAVINPTTPFSGGLISAYTLSIGVGSTTNITKYFAANSVFTGFTNPIQPKMNPGIESYLVDTDITVTAIAVGGTLNQAVAGSADIYLFVAKVA